MTRAWRAPKQYQHASKGKTEACVVRSLLKDCALVQARVSLPASRRKFGCARPASECHYEFACMAVTDSTCKDRVRLASQIASRLQQRFGDVVEREDGAVAHISNKAMLARLVWCMSVMAVAPFKKVRVGVQRQGA
eukprot:6213734-Pleurochrysis_carterae.AAC.1